MSQIITAITKDSILMASDTRLNYHKIKEKDNLKYQVTECIADCCRKTFFLPKAKIGIQFIGIGYLEEKNSKNHLSYFLPKLEEGIKGTEGIKFRMKNIYKNLKKITDFNNLENYVNGIMAGFYKNNSYIGAFNTYVSGEELKIIKTRTGSFVDSENRLKKISMVEEKTIDKIVDIIKKCSSEKSYLIGEEIEILKISLNNAEYIKQGKNLFCGTQKELLDKLQNNPSSINGKKLIPPVWSKIN